MVFTEHQLPFLSFDKKKLPYIECVRFPAANKVLFEVDDPIQTSDQVKSDLKTHYGFTDEQLEHAIVSIIPCSKEEMKARTNKSIEFLFWFQSTIESTPEWFLPAKSLFKTESPEDICAICLDSIKTPYVSCTNHHKWCFDCIRHVWQTTEHCPMCRTTTWI